MSFAQEYLQPPSRWSSALVKFQEYLQPKTAAQLEAMAVAAQQVTRQYFGRTIRMFAPLYLSNECVNICKYCGFSRNNPITRVTLTVDEVEAEARYLFQEGFRSLLLVAGEHPKFVSEGYLEACLRRLQSWIPSLALEVGPMETEAYHALVQAGAEGLVVYQETYQPSSYAELHPSGPKRNFSWRLECPERAYAGGFRRLGIGALFGLAPWKEEALALARHTDYLLKHCWKASLTVSLPRLRPAAGEFQPRYPFEDRDLLQLLCALRLCFPPIGLVLSTRESPALRNHLIPLGITTISAGSHTEPGGYTGAGAQNAYQKKRGQSTCLSTEYHSPLAPQGLNKTAATEQFHIADERSPAQMVQQLRSMNLEAVWKDWDPALLSSK